MACSSPARSSTTSLRSPKRVKRRSAVTTLVPKPRRCTDSNRTLPHQGAGGDHLAGKLSGGNQQKPDAVEWPAIDRHHDQRRRHRIEARNPSRDPPARGGRQGGSHHPSDLPELFAVTDRIVVMRESRIVGQGETQAMTQEEVMALAAGNEAAVMGEAA